MSGWPGSRHFEDRIRNTRIWRVGLRLETHGESSLAVAVP